MQSIHLIPVALLLIRPDIPLLLQFFQVVVDVLLKLSNTLCRKCMAHSLPLPGVFCTVSRIEQPSTNAHESIVVLTLEEPIAMPVNVWYRIGVGDTNMVWLYAYQLSVFGVRSVD